MQPILFTIAGIASNLNGTGIRKRGVAPNFCGFRQLPNPGSILITGVSKDSSGSVLPNCVMTLFRVDTQGQYPSYTQIGTTLSDGSGNYSFTVARGNVYRVTGDNSSGPVAGITVNTLTGA